MRRSSYARAVVVALLSLSSLRLDAQDHQHTPGMQHPASGAQPTEGGQAAFAAIAEIVRLLDADPRTDWSKVNVEALRQHLIDMDEVTMRASVRTEPVEGGAAFIVTGSGRTLDSPSDGRTTAYMASGRPMGEGCAHSIC